jgi:hypothetical protein
MDESAFVHVVSEPVRVKHSHRRGGGAKASWADTSGRTFHVPNFFWIASNFSVDECDNIHHANNSI